MKLIIQIPCYNEAEGTARFACANSERSPG